MLICIFFVCAFGTGWVLVAGKKRSNECSGVVYHEKKIVEEPMMFYFLEAHRPLESRLHQNSPHRPVIFLFFENHLRQTVAAFK